MADRKTSTIVLTEEQFEILTNAAKEVGLNLSAYLRQAGLKEAKNQ